MNPVLLSYCERISSALFAGVWHGAVLLAIVALALRLMPRLSAATRSLIWTAAFVLVVILPLLPAPSVQTLQSVIDPDRAIHLNPAWSLGIAAVWLTLSLYRAAQLLLSARRLRTTSANAGPVADAPSASVQTSFGIRRNATLCVSAEVAQPSVIGFFSPRILVPRDLLPKLSASEIDQVVLHEMEHLRRGDDWRNLLQKLAVMLFPLNPALLWIERRLCFERELACDESVLAQTHAPKSYAACLVHLAEERSLGRQLSLALGAWERRSELGRRVHGILANTAPASSRIRTACASFIAVAMFASTVVLTETPQLLTFTAAPTAFVASAVSAATPLIPRQNVSLRTDDRNKPRVIEAMMRTPVPAAAPLRIKRAVNKTTRPRQIAIASLQPTQPLPPRLVLTSWTYSDGIDIVRVQRVTYAVFTVSTRPQASSSETVQPLPSGLFIIQL